MAHYNRVVMIGNLTRDPDYKQLNNGQAVCRLGLAINRQFKNRQTGVVNQEVCFIDVDVWGAQAESCKQYLQKGRPVLVEGRLKLDSWEDNQGQSRSKHCIVAERVVFLGSSSAPEAGTGENAEEPAAAAPVSPLEKELLDQIDTIKKRQQKNAPVAPAKRATGHKKHAESEDAQVGEELTFKDETPFTDELPF